MNEENITATSFCELLKENKLLLQYNQDLIKENKQLQNNWNELNKFVDKNIKSLEEEMTNKKCDNAVAIYGREMNGFYKVRRKMQEIGDNNG